MSTVTPDNALKLAAWLAVHQPSLFKLLLVQQEQGLRPGSLQGPGTPGNPPLGLGYFGDDSFLQDVSFDPYSVDVSLDTSAAIDAANFDFTPDLQTIGADTAVADIGASSGGFWSSIGNAAESVGSGVLSVAKGLLSPGAITTAAGVASAYFNSQAKTAQTQMQLQAQQAVTQAQLARVNQGVAPAPITYTRDAYGNLVPVYATPRGVTPLNSSALQSLSSPSLGGLPTWAVLGGGALLVALLFSVRSRAP